jgi:phosphoglucomutase
MVCHHRNRTPATAVSAASAVSGAYTAARIDDEESTMPHERAGQTAQAADLIDLAHLVTAYYTTRPEMADPGQRVAFGTSGHRGSSLNGAFTETHIVATTQAICDYRAAQGIAGPLFLGRDTHGLSEPAWASALEVLAANAVATLIDDRNRFTPTPAISHAILRHNRGRAADDRGRADGIVVTPSHNPPADGGFKYNPPHGGPADSDATKWIENRANELIVAGLEGTRRVPLARALAAGTTQRHDYLGHYVDDLPSDLNLAAIREAGIRIGADPLGGASVDYWGEIAEPPPARPDGRQPAGRRHLALHDAGLGRQDPHGLLVAFGDGRADRQPQRVPGLDRQRRRRRPPRHRHARRRADEPQPLPGRRHPVPVLAPPRWGASAAIGKTLVSSSMIDRVAAALGRRLLEVPVGFKWFVPGPARRLGRLRRRGERRRVVPAPGRHGVDNRQGRHPAGAAGRRDPGRDRPVAERALRRTHGRASATRPTPASTPRPPASRRRCWASSRPSRSRPPSSPANRSRPS